MEKRIEQLEGFVADTTPRLARIETRLEVIDTRLDGFATKQELADMKAELIKWIVGTALAITAGAITILTFVLNYATPPRNGPAAPQPPLVIVLPRT
ncbi:hypothetical protein [Massilia sp. TS11]|uniref:hypothetical protein n=1 Tax=Massilia sp. TS11 TaxID=2908003 RepID=UPI001EDAFD36|nr:hypothetical protein [Massilia sp. TS11]MCG2583670.1 hypothetical protein [Massilia sp. TS11]